MMNCIFVHRAEPGWSCEQRSLVLGEHSRRIPVEFFIFTTVPSPGGVGIVGLYFGLVDGEMQQLNGRLSYDPE